MSTRPARHLRTLLSLLPALVTQTMVSPAAAQVSLRDLPALAKDRADRLRPQQTEALKPFWADLSLDYRNNADFLESRIAAAAQLGDSVVPLLLEKLAPSQGGAAARNLAENCRRVLERLDPASFADALIELANGSHETARTEALRLLGHANTQQVVDTLADLLDKVAPDDKRLIVRSLRLLRAAGPAAKVVPMLGSQDRQVREEVLTYLIAARASQVADTVIMALSTESDNRLLVSYIDYFAGCVRRNERAAGALLPLLDRDRIDWQDTRTLVRALADVAPMGHEPTCRRLQIVLENNDTSALAVQAAVTLNLLGDKQGIARLRRAFDEQLRKNRRDADVYERRATLLYEIGEYGDAVDDYEKMLDYAEGSIVRARRAYVGLIRSEARRHKVQNLVKHLKASGMLVAEIEALGSDDPQLAEALQHDRVRACLQQLAKDQAPK